MNLYHLSKLTGEFFFLPGTELKRFFQRLMKRLDEEKELKIFCATRLDRAVNQLSTYFEQNESTQDGEALVALATVKQVRDFLCGSLKFKNSHTKHTIHPATIQVCFYP